MDKEIQFEFDERAAIFEYEGKYTRAEAEKRALNIIERRYRRGYKVEDFKKKQEN